MDYFSFDPDYFPDFEVKCPSFSRCYSSKNGNFVNNNNEDNDANSCINRNMSNSNYRLAPPPSRTDTIRRQPAVEVFSCEKVETKHLHVLPPKSTSSYRAPAEVESWITDVDKSCPLVFIPAENPKVAPRKGMYEIPPDLVVQPDGYLLLRVAKLRMLCGDKNYQLLIRLDNETVLSCPTGKTGNLQDYFLLGLKNITDLSNSNVEIFVFPLENTIEQRVNSKIKNIKSRATELLKLKAFSQKDNKNDEIPTLSLPIAAMFNDPTRPQISGCFYIFASDIDTANVAGEIALDLSASPNSFCSIKRPEGNRTLQEYLTFRQDNHLWKRIYGILNDQHLLIQNFKRHQKQESDPIDLSYVVKVSYIPLHENGIKNVIEIFFEDGKKITAYTDSQDQGIKWTDALYKAIWNTSYIPAI